MSCCCCCCWFFGNAGYLLDEKRGKNKRHIQDRQFVVHAFCVYFSGLYDDLIINVYEHFLCEFICVCVNREREHAEKTACFGKNKATVEQRNSETSN